MKAALVSTFTIKEIEGHLKSYCDNKGIPVEFNFYTSYNLCANELSNQESPLVKDNPEVLFVFIDLPSLLPEYYELTSLDSSSRKKIIEEKFHYLQRLLESYQNKSPKTTVVINNFEVPTFSPFGIVDNKEKLGLKRSVQYLNLLLEEGFMNNKQIFVFDYDGFLSKHGKKNSIDHKFYYLADIKLKGDLMPHLVEEYGTYLQSLQGNMKKCIVLDLDNTLWGGIVGEDGLNGIKLGPTPPGNAFIEFQKILLSFFQKGVILTVNSKNNPKDALQVIREHPHMILKEKHFSTMRINWQDKATNIREIASELNIGMHQMVFFDDDEHNRSLVKSTLPEVFTVDLPKDPALYCETLKEITLFNTIQITEEDKNRSKMYAEERERRELKGSSSDFHDFLKNLEMKITIGEANEFTIPRISQLTQRTNQFNLTTKRYSEADIKNFREDSNKLVYYVSSKDKLGDTGIVGCVIADKNENCLNIDTFLMSCRVLGREIEKVLLDQIIKIAKELGIKKVKGTYIKTKKNVQTQDFYKNQGFSLIAESDGISRWELDTESYVDNFPKFIEVVIKNG